jgi:hypothetical protein
VPCLRSPTPLAYSVGATAPVYEPSELANAYLGSTLGTLLARHKPFGKPYAISDMSRGKQKPGPPASSRRG